MLAVGLLENPLECVLCCLIAIVWPPGQRGKDSGRCFIVPAGERGFASQPPAPHGCGELEPPQTSGYTAASPISLLQAGMGGRPV